MVLELGDAKIMCQHLVSKQYHGSQQLVPEPDGDESMGDMGVHGLEMTTKEIEMLSRGLRLRKGRRSPPENRPNEQKLENQAPPPVEGVPVLEAAMPLMTLSPPTEISISAPLFDVEMRRKKKKTVARRARSQTNSGESSDDSID
ncbi:hypothetical protein COCNU_scaffold015952G000010 [Cocos nucifera]|nr:hypothetical protein [Cocos nucifera]